MLIIKNKRLSQDEEKRMEYKVQQKAIRDYDHYNVSVKIGSNKRYT